MPWPSLCAPLPGDPPRRLEALADSAWARWFFTHGKRRDFQTSRLPLPLWLWSQGVERHPNLALVRWPGHE